MIRSKNVSLQKVYNSILYRPEIEKKRDILLELIESVKFQQCFVFASSHSFAQSASLFLNSKGWANTMLSGSLDQRNRTQAWEQLVDKETTILVATDLACRGLDSSHRSFKRQREHVSSRWKIGAFRRTRRIDP